MKFTVLCILFSWEDLQHVKIITDKTYQNENLPLVEPDAMPEGNRAVIKWL